jgi:hypothetical protein
MLYKILELHKFECLKVITKISDDGVLTAAIYQMGIVSGRMFFTGPLLIRMTKDILILPLTLYDSVNNW